MAWQFDFKEVIAFIESKQEYLEMCEKLFRIYNREITPFLKERIMVDFESVNSQKEVLSRMSPLNILPKIVNKLSTVYAVSAERDVKGLDPARFSELLDTLGFDNASSLANKYLNLFRVVAVEPIAGVDAQGNALSNDVSKLRVYPAHKFLLMDDDTIDNNVVCFIKILGNAQKDVVDSYGRKTTKDVVIYEAYTATEYIHFDSDGIMERDEVKEGESKLWIDQHNFGQIPVVWATRDIVTAMPPVDVDTYSMVTLLPLMFSDLNYAVKYKCFSVLFTIGLTLPSGSMQPNSILQFDNASKVPGEKGELDSISPTVAVEEMLSSIYAQYSLWLESRGIKMQSMARGGGVDNQSGIAKAIDQGEVTEDVVYQRKVFTQFERALFSLLAKFQGAAYEVATTFTEVSIMPETNTEKTDRIIKKLDANLIDWDSAVEQVNSEKNEKQIQEMKLRIMVQRKLKEETESMEAPFAKPEMPKNTDDLEDREDEQTQENERG
jgi:hypothetical protein